MSRKNLIMMGMMGGSAIGSYLPLLWGAELLSVASILLGAIGGLIGIWVFYELTKYVN